MLYFSAVTNIIIVSSITVVGLLYLAVYNVNYDEEMITISNSASIGLKGLVSLSNSIAFAYVLNLILTIML